jgi:hypothetical protein
MYRRNRNKMSEPISDPQNFPLTSILSK